MARRLLKHHQEDARKKIQVAKLISLLQEHVEGKRELSQTQVQSAKILLDKSVSNAVQETNLTGSVTLNWPLPKTALDG